MINEQELETLQQILTEYDKAHRTSKASQQCPRIIEKIDDNQYSHLIQVILNDIQRVLYKHRLEPYKIRDDKTFASDLSLLSAISERGVPYQQEDLQAILSLVNDVFQSFLAVEYHSDSARTPFLHLLSSFVPALQQPEILNYCRSECETLYTYVYRWGTFEPFHESYQLRQQLEALLFGDDAPGLIFQLRRYASGDAPDSDEQAKVLLTILHQELRGLRLYKYDHPVFALLRQASPPVKKSMILLALQEGIGIQSDEITYNNREIVAALITDDLPWTDADIQRILNILAHGGELGNGRRGGIVLLQYALTILKASGKSFRNQPELLTLEARLAQEKMSYMQDKIYALRQSITAMSSPGNSHGLAALLHAYQENQMPDEEQVDTFLAAYQREFGEHIPPLDHPLLQQMRDTLSDSLKARVISTTIQSRSLLERDMNLVTVLSSTPLTCSREDVRAILHSCVTFYSNQNLRNLHNYPHSLTFDERGRFLQWAISITAVLHAIAPAIKQPAIHEYVQEELHTLYAWSQEADYTDYFLNGSQETYALYLLIADLCYAGNPPGLAPLLRDDAEKAESSAEEHARAILVAYHQEMRDGLVNRPYVVEFISQQASEQIKAHLIKEALLDGYTSTLNPPDSYSNHHPVHYKQNVLLIQAIFTYDLPYSYEDIYGILVGIAKLFGLDDSYYRTFQYGPQNIRLFDLFKTFVPVLKPSELERLCQDELAPLYEHLSQVRWHSAQIEENQMRLLIRHLLFPQSAGPLRDLLQDNTRHFTSDSELLILLAAYHEEFGAGTPDIDAELTRLIQQRLGAQSIVRLLRLSAEETHNIQPGSESERREGNTYQVEQDLCLIGTLLNNQLPFVPEDIHMLLHDLLGIRYATHTLRPYVQELEPFLRQPDVLAQCRAEIKWLVNQTKNSLSDPDTRRFHLLLRDLLSERGQQFSYPLLPDRWGTAILDELTDLTPEQRDPWLAILNLCASAKGTAPTDKWQQQAYTLTEAIEPEQLTSTVRRWIDLFCTQKEGRMDGDNSDILRGLIWLCRGNSDRGLAATLADAAIEGYRKLPGEGPRCPKVGDAGIFTLATMPGKDAISQLERIRRNVKQPSYQEKIGKALDGVARREKMSREDLEELMLPTFDLHDGQLQITVGDWTVQLDAGGRKVEPLWFDASGQPQTKLPTAFKREHKDEIKSVDRLADDMQHLISSQRGRLERLYLNPRHWSLEDWRERYLEHPLVSVLARRLIWQISSGAHNWRVIWQHGQLVNAQGQPCELPTQSEVTLWHPLMSEPQEAQLWQLWLEEQQITQPFKQAHREIYPITDAEQDTYDYSRRFADHIIQQHQLNALARARDWQFSLHSNFSGSIQDDPAYIDIPSAGIRAEFTLGNLYQDQEIPRHLLTRKVRFQPITSPFHNQQFKPLEEIPPIVFSEIMRDVDLFVSVTSVGTDIYGHDDGDSLLAEYWQSYNQETPSLQIEARRQILERLLPRLAISERCSLEERFLTVRGDLHTYRIHLISGNIFMQPGDQYLCIVFGGKMRKTEKERFFLPFEGDPLLSLILSKAFLLAEDSKIKDKTILSQIRR
ncbi:hypothetical protein KSD_74600 [Ktedonobacter sp. SOSP1-85]|uniref:DUF4132 domain-containing protein n=1 Tax=Ktedonobacter sp. SOSP1-85 TaxID=2778367 RepID=UPI0019169B10|nr:DUF4132 domain-containing protein [Ktedonobacter sp. SOSP1-85]GHO79689.1 hypothetical protein KSD_74600 [Ktedonobacter sp. SOSP1-85]